MPYTDVNDAMSDPDFYDSLICTRTTNAVGSGGLTAGTQTTIPFFGVVTADRGALLERTADGSRIMGSISVVTATFLTAGNVQYAADQVTWNGRQYVVSHVNDYSRYGRGFYEATCDLLPITG